MERYDLGMDDIEDFSRQLEDELADFELALQGQSLPDIWAL